MNKATNINPAVFARRKRATRLASTINERHGLGDDFLVLDFGRTSN